MQIVDDTSANWLVRHEDGTTDMVGKSTTNRALIEHNLWGLLRDGSEVYVVQETEQYPQVTIVPDDDARSYTLTVGDYEPLHLGPHLKSRLVDALVEGREEQEQSERAAPLVRLFDDIRENRVRSDVIAALSESPPFADDVENTEDGWLIHNHLLLTWEGDFHHPNTTTYERSGSTVEQGSSEPAYALSVSPPDGGNREVTLDGTTYRLTNAEMDFIARALWAVAEAPRGV